MVEDRSFEKLDLHIITGYVQDAFLYIVDIRICTDSVPPLDGRSG